MCKLHHLNLINQVADDHLPTTAATEGSIKSLKQLKVKLKNKAIPVIGREGQ
jgi:5,10-methylene-tetrahydrofolate dehydrogenase/methenyl tetrahydrofolate cyclohydrolase